MVHWMKKTKIKNLLKQCAVIGENSKCARRQFGAIITTPEGVAISGGYNGSIRGALNCGTEVGCAKDALNKRHYADYDVCAAVHAELNAILNAARNGTGVSLKGAVMFLNATREGDAGMPCRTCRRAIINAGITDVYYYDTAQRIIHVSTSSWITNENRWMRERYESG